ncbi:MAG: group 1 truncated hemoglobin [Rhodoferax sp.]|jgi:hemoglobin|nr:group 1 truncated hemoglobin [Rhodoferax sp.]
MMNRRHMLALLGGAVAWHTAAAQTPAAPDDALYRALGEKPGITALMNDTVERLFTDPQIGRFFKDTKPANLKEQLRDQVCFLSGGPCKYEGDTMKAVHAELGIRKADFNRMVEVLQAAMDARSIPFATQNRLLALLAPMHRDIITR